MGTVRLAKTAGFCFGVNRAVESVEELVRKGEKVYTLGPIIHNAQVVGRLEASGVRSISEPDEMNGDGVLVIRSHGVPLSVYDEIKSKELRYMDATCPFVAKIHKIVAKAAESKQPVLIAGDSKHPEVLGIKGHCMGEVYVFGNEEELKELLSSRTHLAKENVCVVAQTTYNTQIWQNCIEILKKVCTNASIYDTICSATLSRQQEAMELARESDLMIIIGGKNSSNTQKLFKICSDCCSSHAIETAAEIPVKEVLKAERIGITAGASTPADVIKEVVLTVSEIMTENFEAMLEESFKQSNTNGKVVNGTVVRIAPNEIYVDVGRKQSGIVMLEDLTDDPNLTTSDVVKVGDELELMIMRTNDQEGYIYLSKKLLDSAKAWEEIKAAAPKIVEKKRRRYDDEDTLEAAEEEAVEEPVEEVKEEEKEPVTFEGVVTEVNKGGVVVSYKGVRVFVPASQATMSRNDSMEDLLKKKVQFQLLEVTPSRKRAVGSINKASRRERAAAEKKFWSEVEVGKIYTGTVRSLVKYGAFVDIGGVDGLVHITELSWQRISDPSEVVNVGDVVEVYVKKIDEEKKKVSLGYRKMEDNPWEIMKVKYPVGTVIESKVVGTPAFGAFVNILPGIDGLVHISQLSTQRVNAPTDVVNVGDTVKAVITEVDFDRKRVSLSIRQLLEAEAAEEAPVEETVAE